MGPSGLAPFAILHIDTEVAWRGGQEALLRLAKGLRERGHSQVIACPSHSELAARSEAEGFETLPSVRSREVRRRLLAGRFHIVHAHTGRAQNVAALASLNMGVKRVVTRHVAFPPRHALIHKLKYSLTCDGIIAVSDAVRARLADTGISPGMIAVIHSGVEIPTALPDAEARKRARAHFGVAPYGFVIGHMGAFAREKGQDVAIEAVAAGRGLFRCQLILAGEGELAEEAKRRATELGVDAKFPGFVEDHALFYAALDLFVMPSRSEAWGLAALEAMAFGIPVVASDVGGLREMIGDGPGLAPGGWLVPPGDTRALAQTIREATEHELRMIVAAAARKRAERFSVAKTVALTEDFYRRVLGTTEPLSASR